MGRLDSLVEKLHYLGAQHAYTLFTIYKQTARRGYCVQQNKEIGLAKNGRSNSLCKGNNLQAINMIFGLKEQGCNYG